MSKKKRLNIIREIEKLRNSRVIVYITGDRPGFETRIAKDILPIFYNHLIKFENAENIDLFIYSLGGDTLAGFALVNHIREFCEKFCVLIPFRALSAATLISLGADEIVMGKLGQLSPIDPSITTPYNPTIPGPPQQPPKFLPVSVEDVGSFIDLAKKEIGLPESNYSDILNILGNKIHPISLGSVFRAREQIGMLASKLLGFHYRDKEKIQSLVKMLTRELFSHDYIITRTEAQKSLKLNIKIPDIQVEKTMWNLLNLYLEEMEISKRFNEDTFLGEQESRTGIFKRAYIESTNRTDFFFSEKSFNKIQLQPPVVPFPQSGVQQKILNEGWKLE